jgi:hypothetical protein
MAQTTQTAASTPSLTIGSAAEVQAAKKAATRLAIEARRDASLEAARIEQAKLDRIDADNAARELQTDEEQRATFLRSEQNDWQRRKRFDIAGSRGKAEALETTAYQLFKRIYGEWRRKEMPVRGVEIAEDKLAKWIGRKPRQVRNIVANLKAYGLEVTERPRGYKGHHNRYWFLDYPVAVNEAGDDVVLVMDRLIGPHH